MTDRLPIDGLSHVRGPTDVPLLEETIPQVLARTRAERPEATAAIFCDRGLTWTWAEFAAEVDRLARGLTALGLTTGDRLGIWSPNSPEWLLMQFATARIGVILVTINPAYKSAEMAFVVRKTGCKAIVLAPGFKSSDYVAMVREAALDCALILTGPVTPGDMRGFDDLMREGDALPEMPDDPHAPINIQFTSGTTGAPKGATLTHRNIVNNGFFTTRALALGPGDRLCLPVPLYHCFGMVMGTLGCVTQGAAMVFPGPGFDPLATLRAIEETRATALYAVPTMFVAMLEHPDFARFDLSSLRTGIMAGAPCPIETMRKVRRDMHMAGVTIAYGMTETAPVSFQSDLDTPLEKRVASVGRVHPHVEVRIVDDHDRPVPVGEQGELQTRGYSVMQGYWDEPAKTAEVLRDDGWMRTGDLARLDAEGYARITGRLKDMIVRGGENVYPKEIEDMLMEHPEVSMAQVFGIPDARLGESVAAWIVPAKGTRPDPDALRAWAAERMAHYKVPATVRLVEDFPLTVSGKPQKFLMRAAMVEELGLEEAETA